MIKTFYSILLLLPKKHIYLVLLLIPLLILLSFIDLIGLSLIPGLIILLFDLEKLIKYLKKINLDNEYLLNFIKDENYILFFSVIILIIFIIKNFMLFSINFYQGRLFKQIQINLSKNLFQSYLDLNYENYIEYNTAKIIRNITSEVNHLKTYIKTFVELFKEFILFIFIFLALMFIDYRITLAIITTLLIFGVFFISLVKLSLKKSSSTAILYRFEFLKLINQSISIYKIIKIFDLKTNLLKKFKYNLEKEEKELFFQYIISTLPKIFLEIISILILLSCFIFIIQGDNKDPIANLTTISFFGIALVRILPSINSIMVSVTQLKILKVPSTIIYKELNYYFKKKLPKYENIKKDHAVISKGFNLVNIKNLSFSYKNGNKILKNVNLTFKKGDMIGISGPSGSGKSTFVDLVMCVINSYSGSIKVDSIDVKNDIKNWQKKFGYVPQETYIFDENLKDNITFGINKDKVDEIWLKKIIDISKLKNLKQNISTEKSRKIKLGDKGVKVSGGQKQRIGIARALYHKPEILILDESLNALDRKNKIEIINDLKKLNYDLTIILISHDDELLNLCDKILRLK